MAPISPGHGIHHVTAIAGDPQRTLDFYAGVLGLRLVKRTVNFDDPNTYHFYFGDELGRPGTILTFFPWPGAWRGSQGTGQVGETSFAVPPAAIGFWLERFLRHGVGYQGPSKRIIAGTPESVLSFRDPDGLLLELVGDPRTDGRPARSDGIPAEVAIRGLFGVTIWAERGEETERVLTETLGLSVVGDGPDRRRFAASRSGPGAVVDVRSIGGFPRGAEGVGTVHHVAWRCPDDAAEQALRERVIEAGLEPTPVIDRSYFRSVYFREPGGVLFELATDGPGFLIDEPADRLGERLMLPARLESDRGAIEARLPAVRLPQPAVGSAFDSGSDRDLGFVHRYLPATEEGKPTLLLLHGTGGDEDDLIPLGGALMPGAGLLSPRGKVLERGAPRFFRRLAEGVFDLEDLARRSDELGRFIEAAARLYGLDSGAVVAVGFSNGANIAASLLLRHPGLLRGAVLLSPMVPFEPQGTVDLTGTEVFVGAGRADRIVPADQPERLANLLRRFGAGVTLHWEPGGHAVSESELAAARAWLEERWGGPIS